MGSNGVFKEWLNEADEQKKLISFSGRIRPLVRERISTELSKNLKDICHELSSAFYDAHVGKLRNGNQAVTIWEVPLSPRPIHFGKRNVGIGSAVVAYQLPIPKDNKVNPKVSELSNEDREKFIREREKYFSDFIKNVMLGSSALDNIVDDLVQRVYTAVKDKETLEGPQAKVVWKGKVTSGPRYLGRVLIALRLPVDQEKALEKAVQDS